MKRKSILTWKFHGVPLKRVAVLHKGLGAEKGLFGGCTRRETYHAVLVVHHGDYNANRVDAHFDRDARNGHEVG